MLSESFIAATESVKAAAAHLSSQVKDVGIFIHELQPQVRILQGLKRSSVSKNCVAYSDSHVFAAQAGKAVVNVYNREKGNQEATVPFPSKVTSLAFAEQSAILIIGTQDGSLMLWEIATGRVTSSTSSHVEGVTHIVVSPDGGYILSASSDTTIHIWSLSRMISFERLSELGESANNNEPVATWTQHRSAIRALAIGHSKNSATNFVISASDDKTCHIWSLDGLQLLRTYILSEIPQCVVLDPADRAIYFGSDDGSIQHIDLLSSQSASKRSILSATAQEASTPIQLKPSAQWHTPLDTAAGPAQCITCSYDGMTLLSGHASGKILRWEVAKHRMVGELPALTGQPVTNLATLLPSGFTASKADRIYTIPTIVKPRLDLNSANNDEASSVVPADYTTNVQVRHVLNKMPMTDLDLAFETPHLPQSLIDDAVQALNRDAVSNSNGKTIQTGNNSARINQLEKELAAMQSLVKQNEIQSQERLKRHQARMERRQNIGQQKRDAFFVAKKAGKNGDDAMKPFSKLEQEIDIESDEDVVAEAQKDVTMAG